jgi:hypothetical protein
MSGPPSNTLRALGLGTAIAVLTALACLAGAAARDAQTLSLRQFEQLTHAESVLMSCAADSWPASSSGTDLLWCSDPTSPHCRPAAPQAPQIELWDRPDSVLLPVLQVPVATYVWLPWPRPEAAPLLTRSASDRLERPPRA